MAFRNKKKVKLILFFSQLMLPLEIEKYYVIKNKNYV